MQYYKENDYMVGVCKSGYKFIFDEECYEEVSKYNWFVHSGRVEGNIGGKGKRVMLSRIIANAISKTVIIRRVKNNDYRKSNLFFGNEYKKIDNYYFVSTISGDDFIISECDYEKVKKLQWQINSQGYPEATLNKRRVKIHRYILDLLEFKGYSEVVDHINRDPRDNRRENLRIVTQAENCNNSSIKSTNTSGYKNIFFQKDINKWRVYKTYRGKRYEGGCFDNLYEAIVARDNLLLLLR